MVGLWGRIVVNPVIYALPYDVPTSFEPAGLISTTPHLIAAKQAFPANDLKGLIAWLKSNPGKATVGHAGAGSPPHVGAVFFQNATGTSFQLVPYRGAGPAMQDLVAGQIDMLIDSPVTVVPQLRLARSRLLRSPRRAASPPRRRFRPSTKRACRASISPTGSGSMRPRARRSRS
jgi:tripartite-type tricarboxylate transporter receptor subunit TctC